MPEPLTRLERRILDFLVDYLRRHTYQPSIREIGRRFGIKSTKTVSEYLQSLADKGWIERDPSRSRGVRLLGLDLKPDCVSVPVYTDGFPAVSAPAGAPPDRVELDRRIAGPAGSFLVAMRGDSMVGEGIRDGDLLLVEPVASSEVEDGDVVAARVGGDGTIKRYFHRGGEVVLEPANPDYPPTLVRAGDAFEILGRVAGVFRRVGGASLLEAAPLADGGTALP